MPGLQLKPYQQESLDRIGEYCDLVRRYAETGAPRPERDAYEKLTERDYYTPPHGEGTPHFCIRIPTGGGKTLLAAHAVGVIAKRLAARDHPVCLWVTPGTTIQNQTLSALRTRSHPYRLALEAHVGGGVEVLTLEEALTQGGTMLRGGPVVIVATRQSYNIESGNDSARRVYRDNGYLMEHFSNLPDWAKIELEPDERGRVAMSLANALRLQAPVVIMDEAHNARTQQAFESLARFGPAAVLELTATPQREHDPQRDQFASNVLHTVSPLELHREGMIKLPVELESRQDWFDVLVATKQRRDELEQAAKRLAPGGRTIRPIALIQAQSASRRHETQEPGAVRDALVNRLQIDESHVRIATGSTDELDNEDPMHPDSEIRYIITINKLREGWDCPNAYVVGSIGNVATETAVEQLLGRVLRMPGAEKTGIPELDRAYAVVLSPNVLETARGLRNGLIERCGFDERTADDAFRVHRAESPRDRLPHSSLRLSGQPKLDRLAPTLRDKVSFDTDDGVLQIHDALTQREAAQIRDSLSEESDKAAVDDYWDSHRPPGSAPKNLDEYADPFRAPRMVVREEDTPYLFEPEELDEFEWDLDSCDSALAEDEFSIELEAGQHIEITVDDLTGAIRIGSSRPVIVRQLSLIQEREDLSQNDLVRWIDAELRRGDRFIGLPKSLSEPWLRRVVGHLINKREADIKVLVRKRHILADVIRAHVAAHGREQVRKASDRLIRGDSSRTLETSFDLPFTLDEQDYCPSREYHGPYDLKKHAFDLIGAMDNDAETECAKRIDDHPNVKRWLRNISSESAGGFSLPLSPGNFFPDFLCELHDGRVAVVEYKGADRSEHPEELHKKSVGELWAGRSNGCAVFAWVVGERWTDLGAALAARDGKQGA